MSGFPLIIGRRRPAQAEEPSALAALLEQADAAQAAASQMGGSGASAPIADASTLALLQRPAPAEEVATLPAFLGAPVAQPAAPIAAPVQPTQPSPLALFQPVSPGDIPVPAAPPPRPMGAPARRRVLGLLQRPVTPEEAAAGARIAEATPLPAPPPPVTLPTGPADTADLTGNAPPQRPRSTGGPRRGVRSVFRAPPPPPTEEQINEQLIAELTARPADDAPLVPADFRGESPLEVQERQIEERAQLERQTADQAAIRAADLADQEAALSEQRARVQEQRQAALTGARQRYEGALERAASMQIEPERFFRSRGLLGQVGAAIAMAVGSFAEAATGAPNRAAQIIDGAITRDIEAQRLNISNAREAAEGQRGVYQLMRQEYEDENAALDATRAAMLTEAARRAEIEGSQAQSEDARLRANELRTRLEAEARAAQEQATMREALRLLEARRALAETVKLEGDARTSLANATRAERRAMGGGGPRRPATITQQQMETFNQLRNSGIEPADAAARAGIDPAAVPAGGANFSTASDQEAANLAALQSSLRRIEELMPADGEDVPGFGRFAGNLPDLLVTEQGVELREEFANANDLMGRLRSGGAIGREENETFTAIMQGTTDESARRGVVRLQREIDARLRRRVPGSRSADLDRSSAAVGFTPEGGE